MSTTTQPVPQVQNQSYPQEIEVNISMKIRVSSQEEKDFYLNSETGAPEVNLLADLMDQFFWYEIGDIVSLNNLTPDQVRSILAKAAGV